MSNQHHGAPEQIGASTPRAAHIAAIARAYAPLEPGQSYAVDHFRPEDAPGIARLYYGAVLGCGWGRQGNSYAIPTKDENLRRLGLREIQAWCWAFVEHARAHPEDRFYITPVGCGLAGYEQMQIRPFFYAVPDNCEFAETWND